ncbi:MAG TPA: ATP-grasp domain-containing protein [Burkholderiaceae bacterium]|nr:ATP-grasp domain-containing protein [Burkholderiaceae bacterium]
MAGSVFVYEYLSGGGQPAQQEAHPAARHLLAQGRSMRDAIVADLVRIEEIEITCATIEGDRPIAASRLRYAVARRGQSARDFVRVMARAHDLVWVVAPESDAALATLAAAVPGGQWIGCDAPTIALASSKSSTARHLAQAGIAATSPWRPGAVAVAGRWVVKPDDGAGACDAQVFASFEAGEFEWRRRVELGKVAVLEPWIDGEALSVSMLCSAWRTELLAINRQHVDVDERGQVSFRGVSIDAVDRASTLGRQVARVATRAAQTLPGLRGFVGFDLVAAPHGPVVIEINPRLTCAYVGLSHRLGRNLARDVLAMFRSDIARREGHASFRSA